VPYGDSCIFGTDGGPRLLAVWGDSHGAELAYALGAHARDLRMNVLQITSSACPPAADYEPPDRPHCIEQNRDILDNIVKDDRVGTVVLTANGIGYRSNKPKLMEGLESVVRTLIASGKKVILVEQQPFFDSVPPNTLGYASMRGLDLSTLGLSEAAYDEKASDWNRSLERLGQRYGADVISAKDALCWNGFCPMQHGSNGILYFNRNHVSLRGAELLARKVMEKMPED